MKLLPSLSSLPPYTTKGDLISLVDPQVAYDIALPQEWVDRITQKGFDPRFEVVWAYPHGYVFGLPMPLTEEARRHLAELKQATWEDPAGVARAPGADRVLSFGPRGGVRID